MITLTFNGTSHGKGYSGVIEGLPQGFAVDVAAVNKQLARRKDGFGRSGRKVFADIVQFEGANGNVVTVNGALRFFVPNACVEQRGDITALRSGHVDLVGQARFADASARQLAEIASARNSVCYVVLGAVCKQLLQQNGVKTYSFTQQIGDIVCKTPYDAERTPMQPSFGTLHCPSEADTQKMCDAIERHRAEGNSLGGVVVAVASGVPMGVGEILPYNLRLDAQISSWLVGIPSVKGVSFGWGGKLAEMDGVSAADELTVENGQIVYATNKCGGIVGGISTGGDIRCELVVKPVPTVKGVATVDSVTKDRCMQHYERADTCVVPNVGVIAENLLAYVIANQMLAQGLL